MSIIIMPISYWLLSTRWLRAHFIKDLAGGLLRAMPDAKKYITGLNVIENKLHETGRSYEGIANRS